MGLILDSTAVVAAERQGQNARQLLESVAVLTGEDEIAMSVMTAVELAHGVIRASAPERGDKRRRFLHELLKGVPIHPVTTAVALRAGQIDGECQAKGVRIPLADLLIGVTALELGYSIATANVRHFRLIPRLNVLPLISPLNK